MVSVLIDIILIGIVALCIWRGFKNRVIRGVCGILALIVSIYAASVFASAYSYEFSGLIEPFAAGLADSAVTTVLNDGQFDKEGKLIPPVVYVEDKDKTDVYTVSFAALRQLGVSEDAAEKLALSASEGVTQVNHQMAATISAELSNTLAYVIVFGICFIIIAIVFAAIANVIDLQFSIPGIEGAEPYIGLGLGLIQGIIIMFTITLLVRYVGMLLSEETINNTRLLRLIININPIAKILGV